MDFGNFANVLKTGVSKVGGAIKTGANRVGNTLNKANQVLLPDVDTTGKEQLAQKLLQGSNSTQSSMPQQTQYQFTPIMTDYSQYMGLSPETQRYLYGRW